MVIDVSYWGALSWGFFFFGWFTPSSLGHQIASAWLRAKTATWLPALSLAFFLARLWIKKARLKWGKRDTNTTTDIPDKQEEKLKPGHEGHKHLILGFRAITILFKKNPSFNRQEVFDLLEDGTYGGRAKTKVQQFINFNMTSAARVWTEWDHQLSKNIEACLHEMRQDFLITVSGLTKGKWLKRRPSTVNTVWRGLCGESSFQCYERNAKGCGRKKTQGLDSLYRPGAKLFFQCLHEFWPMCEVQETFLQIADLQ